MSPLVVTRERQTLPTTKRAHRASRAVMTQVGRREEKEIKGLLPFSCSAYSASFLLKMKTPIRRQNCSCCCCFRTRSPHSTHQHLLLLRSRGFSVTLPFLPVVRGYCVPSRRPSTPFRQRPRGMRRKGKKKELQRTKPRVGRCGRAAWTCGTAKPACRRNRAAAER